MKLRKLSVKNFRGIREMEWNLGGDMACLIGPSDSTKSTILLALEYLFSGSWGLSVSDVDFYDLNVGAPIEISAVITELPEALISEDKFGLFLGFWNPADHELHEEQGEGSYQKALKIRLEISQDLEPKWTVVSLQENGREPLTISATDRRGLGVAKIGNYIESDLAWGRNSALSRLTEKDDIAQIPAMLAAAERSALSSLESMDFAVLSRTIEDLLSATRQLGIDERTGFHPGMDPMRISLRQGAIALLDGNLPVALRGAGSRRMIVMAIHKAAVKEGAVILVDEIENSLEPYRLRHLIRQLRPKPGDTHQMIFTTHSSIALVECRANELFVVRSNNGVTTATDVGMRLQATIRSIPEAFLARRIVVCEGKTEAGLLIGLDSTYWQEKHESDPSQFKYRTMAEAGATPVDAPGGGGDESPGLALALSGLGYQVGFFGDSDKIENLNPSVEQMRQAGIDVVLWPENGNRGLALEERLCLDLPLAGLDELIELAIELEQNENRPDDVRQRIVQTLSSKGFQLQPTHSLDELIQLSNEQAVRESIGTAAKQRSAAWFKRKDKGMRLGELLARHLDGMRNTLTFQTLAQLEDWCYVRQF